MIPGSEKELEQIRTEIAALEAEKNRLELLENIKIQQLKSKLTIIPTRFAAQHPVVSMLLKGTGHVLKEGAKAGANAIGEFYSDKPKAKKIRKGLERFSTALLGKEKEAYA